MIRGAGRPRWGRDRSRKRGYPPRPSEEYEEAKRMQLKFTTAGESHGKGLIALIEGIPAGLGIDAERDINPDLRRRQGGYGRGGRMRIEQDAVEFLSGVRFGET